MEEGRGGAARLSRLTLDHRRFFPIPTAWEPCSLGLGLGGLAGQSWAQRSCVSLVTMELPLPLPHHLLSPPCTLTSQHLLPPNTIPGLGKCAVSSPGLPCFSEREAEFLAPPPATRHPLPGGVGGGQERSAGPGVSGFPGCPLGALRCLSSFRRQLYRDFLRIPRHSPAQADKSVFFGVFTELGHVATVIIPKRHSVPIKATPRFALFHHQPTVCPYRSACLDTWREWNRVLCGFFVTGFFL